MDYGAVCGLLEQKTTSREDIPANVPSPYVYGYSMQYPGYNPSLLHHMTMSGMANSFGNQGFTGNINPNMDTTTCIDQMVSSRAHATRVVKQEPSSPPPLEPSWHAPHAPQSPWYATPTASPSECLKSEATNSEASAASVASSVASSSSSSRIRKKPMQPGKPAYSYISLICMALQNSQGQQATLKEIISYIENKFPFYKSKTNWHGSIRHNLTLNDCFRKMARHPGEKGCHWTIDPNFMDMFDNGSLLRRKYRFKEGSPKWLKNRDNSLKRHVQMTSQTTSPVICPSNIAPSNIAPSIIAPSNMPPISIAPSNISPGNMASASCVMTSDMTPPQPTTQTEAQKVPQLQYPVCDFRQYGGLPPSYPAEYGL